MPSSLALVLLLALPAAREEGPPPRVELIDRILAVVDDRPLLLSEVRAVEEVKGLDRAAALREAIDERLMAEEAARLPQAEVSDEETDRALAKLLGDHPGLESRVSRAELRRLVRRQAAIYKYVEFRFRPQVRITEAELLAAWEEAHAAGTAGEFGEAEPSLRARLERRAIDERIEEWVKDLRSRAEVRYVEGPDSPPPTPPVAPPAAEEGSGP
jgi:hypothetical protein